MTNEERGWTRDSREVLLYRAVLCAAERQETMRGQIASVADVASALEIDGPSVASIFRTLVADGAADDDGGMTDSSRSAHLTEWGLARARAWRSLSQQPRSRRVACRDALLDWLDAEGEGAASFEPFEGDVRAFFFGSPFTKNEVVAAAEFLRDQGLIAGMSSSWGGGPLRPRLTSEGHKCLERHDGSVVDYQQAPVGGTSNVNVSHSQNVNVASLSSGTQQSNVLLVEAVQKSTTALDTFEATRPVLGLDEEQESEAATAVEELRRELAQPTPDRGKVRAALETVKAISVGGAGAAAGQGVVALVEIALAAWGG